jgi:translation initiation factor 1
VRVRRERSGRRGKTVTTAGPLPLSRSEATALLGQLKRRCGSGGTLKLEPSTEGPAAFRIEIQGDHVDRLLEELHTRGFKAKQAGG